MTQQEDGNKEFDIFIANSIYPEASAVFNWRPRPLEDIKDECIVILDTNTLLVPYTITPKSLDEIGQTYRVLAEQQRLVVPGQVAREFATHRATKLAELYQHLETRKNQVKQLQKGKYPLLESLEAYQETLALEKDIDKLTKQYQKALTQVTDHVRRWIWNDPVSILYEELFDKRVIFDPSFGDPNFNKSNIQKDLKRRQTHKIPPGYKDAGKDDKGIGDLLIWHTILKIGEEREKSIVFVSNDEKPDWWYQSGGSALYPRYELVDEYRRRSRGQSFHILKFSDFLNLYGVDKDVVEEVRKEEAQSSRASGNAILLPTGPILVVRHKGKYGAVKALAQTDHQQDASILYSWWYQPDGSVFLGDSTAQTGHGKTWENGYGNPPSPSGTGATLQVGPIELEWSAYRADAGWVYFGPPGAHSSEYELAVSDETDIWKVDVSRLMFAHVSD